MERVRQAKQESDTHQTKGMHQVTDDRKQHEEEYRGRDKMNSDGNRTDTTRGKRQKSLYECMRGESICKERNDGVEGR